MENIVIFGNGAREHCIIEKLLENTNINKIYTIDKNDFIENEKIDTSLNCLQDILDSNKTINMVIFGPEQNLVEGYVDILESHNIKCFGPNKRASNIEGSKIFSKLMMDKFHIPTSDYTIFNNNYDELCKYLETINIQNYVIKLSGLAGGKGAFLPDTKEEALEIVKNIYVNNSYGENKDIIIEERLYGKEVSVMGFCNGKEIFLLPQCQDFKRLNDNNIGPNTGGMGAYAPANILSSNELDELKQYMDKIVKELNYVGILYAGVMKTTHDINSSYKLLEFNCRFGDPECQVLLNMLENDLYTTMYKCINGEKLDLKFKNVSCSNVVLSHLDYPYKKSKDNFKLNLDYSINDLNNIKLYGSNIKKIDNDYYSNGGRIMSVVSYDTNLFKSVSNCYNLIKHISYENMYFRNDIGLEYCLQAQNVNNLNCKKIAILSSGTGNSCKTLLENIKSNNLKSSVDVIITNRSDAKIIDLAKAYKISYIYLSKKKDIDNITYDIQLLTILKSYNIDIIFLVGYMRIISYTIIDSYKNKIFNIHPSLLPKYTNMMDLNIHQSVIENNDIYTGCTLHIVEKDIDEGKIILQEKTKVLTTDKYELKTIVQELENKCILNCVKLIENNCINNKLTYDDCGVNIEKGNTFISIIKNILGANNKSNIGKFCSIYDYKDIKIAASTDGVGSKLEIANKLKNYSSVGIDLVAMCVNDLIVHGARPLFMLDYIAVHSLNIEQQTQIIESINNGCKIAKCDLVGGETAELPSIFYPNKYDLGGFSVGVIEKDLYPKTINEDDIILGLYSNGIHSNGYSLILELLKNNSYSLEELNKPTKIYVNTVMELNNYDFIKGYAHITGGGIIENLPRILPKELSFEINKSWKVHDEFKWIQKCSKLSQNEMLKTFNCGIGMVVIVSKDYDINIIKKYNMVIIGKIIKSEKPIINVNLFE